MASARKRLGNSTSLRIRHTQQTHTNSMVFKSLTPPLSTRTTQPTPVLGVGISMRTRVHPFARFKYFSNSASRACDSSPSLPRPTCRCSLGTPKGRVASRRTPHYPATMALVGEFRPTSPSRLRPTRAGGPNGRPSRGGPRIISSRARSQITRTGSGATSPCVSPPSPSEVAHSCGAARRAPSRRRRRGRCGDQLPGPPSPADRVVDARS